VLSRISGRIARLWVRAVLATLALSMAVAANAAIEITFYAREFGSQFPHGFVTLAGTPDRGGDRIDTNYGFTATHVSPAILFGSVRGTVEPVGASYMRGSEAHFAINLTDAEYDQVMATVERYRVLAQPSYSLNRRNCVHFIADVAGAIGMRAEVPRNLTRRPRSFIELMIRDNRDWLTQRQARILREPPEPRPARRSTERGG